MGLNLEIKPAAKGLGALTLERSLQVLKNCPAINLVISSFDFSALEAARHLAPNIPRALIYEALPADWCDAVHKFEVRSVHLANLDSLKASTIANIREQGLEVYVYTVNSLDRAKELLNWGVKGVFSDFPNRFTRLMASASKRVSAYGDPL